MVDCRSPDQDGRDRWGSAGICGDLWGSVGICGDLWGSMGICGGLWGSVGICGGLRGSAGIYLAHTLRHSETFLVGPARFPVLQPLAPGKILSRTGRTAPLRTLDTTERACSY